MREGNQDMLHTQSVLESAGCVLFFNGLFARCFVIQCSKVWKGSNDKKIRNECI